MKSTNEFYPRSRSEVCPKIADKDLAARLFLQHIQGMRHSESIFFEAHDSQSKRRISSRIRTRLWRYAEAGHIKFREFCLWEVEGGFSLIKNIDPSEDHRKGSTSLKRKGGRVVEGGGLETR